MSQDWEIEGFLENRDGIFHIDGQSAVDIAAAQGTPVFVFSKKRIRHNINRLLKIQDVIGCKLKVCYAAKANSNKQILSTVLESGIDIEVNSGGELKMALDAGFEGRQIIFNGTSKTSEEIGAAIKADIYAIQADSLYELELIEETAEYLHRRANVSLRLVPEIESETHSGLQTALLTSKFGMMPESALDALRRWDPGHRRMNICGVHIHIGSQNSNKSSYERALTVLFENLLRIRSETGHDLRHLNVGGGFPVNYLKDDSHAAFINPKQRALLSASYEPADAIGPAWAKIQKMAAASESLEYLHSIELLIEPGRNIIGDAGVCLTTVRNHKERPIRGGSGFGVQSSEAEVSSRFNDQSSKPVVLGSEPPTELDSDRIQHAKHDSEVKESNFEARTSKVERDKFAPDSGTLNFVRGEPILSPVTDHSSRVTSHDTWLLTDAGFNILLSMETYKWYYHLIHATRAGEPHTYPYKVAGPLCDGGDVYFDIEGHYRLPEYRLLPENVRPGDLMALLNTGAYTVSQMFPYNGRTLPAIVVK